MADFIRNSKSGYQVASPCSEADKLAGQCCLRCTMALRQILTCNNCYSKLGNNLICLLMSQLCNILEPEVKFIENRCSNLPISNQKQQRISSKGRSQLNSSVICKRNKPEKLPEIEVSKMNRNICTPVVKEGVAKSKIEDSLNISNSSNKLFNNVIYENEELDQKRLSCTFKKIPSNPIGSLQNLKIPSLINNKRKQVLKRRHSRLKINLQNKLPKFVENSTICTSQYGAFQNLNCNSIIVNKDDIAQEEIVNQKTFNHEDVDEISKNKEMVDSDLIKKSITTPRKELRQHQIDQKITEESDCE